MKAAVLTVSTSVATGESKDLSGPALVHCLTGAGAEIVDHRTAPDDRSRIVDALRAQIAAGAQVILTTGGTGFTPDDITPEATAELVDRPAPGYAEAMRAEAVRHTPMGVLTRGVSGIAGQTLIINFPGNPKAIGELFPIIEPTLSHAVATLNRTGGRDSDPHHTRG